MAEIDPELLAEAMTDAADERENVEPASVESLAKLIQDQLRLEDEVAELEERVKEKKAALTRISEYRLPDMLLELKTTGWTTEDGGKVTLKKTFFPSVKKDDMPKFADWLVETERAGIVSPTITITLPKGDWELAKELRDKVKQLTNHEVELTPDIHWATFRAFAREMSELKGDEKVEMPSYYKVHSAHSAVIKRKKAK